jgi:hypothetical protein
MYLGNFYMIHLFEICSQNAILQNRVRFDPRLVREILWQVNGESSLFIEATNDM